MGLEEEVKMRSWEALDEVVRSMPSSEKIVIAGDFNGHIRILPGGYDEVHGGFGFGDRNNEEAVRSASCIIETDRGVLGVSKGRAGRPKENWWWNEEVNKKVEIMKGVYIKLIESKDAEENWVNREVYKVARKESK
ncbi:uncharacterized protein LOC107861692 [Capsicum annuum]|uniref:uncharacterized protein LOC107861692 n=1 Tax=Capsicum annuum TaxID=4072 RepID=UPI001FB057A9|nr:uncharacterized protein LOC107861692 [Capsicum annuum]